MRLNLESIQINIINSLFKDNADLNFISSDYPKERLIIYRNNMCIVLSQTLKTIYPGIWKLLGEECANAASYKFLQNTAHWPSSPLHDNWAEKFVEFLSQRNELKAIKYLKDFAQYQWLQYLSTSNQYENYAINNIEEVDVLSLKLRPGIFLHSSHFALHKIEDFINNISKSSFELGNYYFIVLQSNNKVIAKVVSKDFWRFIQIMQNNQTIINTYEIMLQHNNKFDLSGVIDFLIEYNMLHY
ncbi:MAG: putative DNA-binding domain-containing protein [Rickettsiaceae bacterium]